jgi:Lon protease-like protein
MTSPPRPPPPRAGGVRVMPMFPLGSVLLPGMHLPLHVFEPRYRELVRVCIGGDGEFGVVLIERGSEVGGGDSRFGTGCVARILGATRAEDGRWLLATVGTRRIRVRSWLPDDPFPRADVEEWPDPPAGPEAVRLRDAAASALRRLLALVAEAGIAAPPATVDVPRDPAEAAFAMTALAPLGPLDRLRLLEAGTVEERLDALATRVEEATAVVANRLTEG